MQPSNILKIDSLNEHWRDKDSVMLHACFQLLKDCVEKENLLTGDIDWTGDEKHRQVKVELDELYSWWLTRQEIQDQYGLDEQQYKEDDSMLHRLVSIRWVLWT
jgi:hypothetical protein